MVGEVSHLVRKLVIIYPGNWLHTAHLVSGLSLRLCHCTWLVDEGSPQPEGTL